jgi:uncharacterized membrane protein
MRIALAAAIGSIVTFSLIEIGPEHVGGAPAMQGRKPPSGEIATLTKLPSLGSNAEAHAVNEAGTVVVGHSFDRGGLLYAVAWTLRNGSWVIAKLPYAGKAALAHGVSGAGDAVGYVGSSPRYPALWPATSGYTTLGCASEAGEALAVSPDGLVIVGHSSGRPLVWASSSGCAESLPPLVPGVGAVARAVNGDGSIIGGFAARVLQSTNWPVRWTGPAGARQIEELDARPGYVFGANAAGDLAGQVTIACALESGCQRTVIWYANGGLTELGTLGGEHSWSRDINTQQEVVGVSTSPAGINTAYFWSQATGMFPLAGNKLAVANGLSDVRSDGTRLVVGMDAQANAAVWVVRTP